MTHTSASEAVGEPLHVAAKGERRVGRRRGELGELEPRQEPTQQLAQRRRRGRGARQRLEGGVRGGGVGGREGGEQRVPEQRVLVPVG